MWLEQFERKQGKKVVKLFEKLGCTSHQTFLGKGTAPVEVFELLDDLLAVDALSEYFDFGTYNGSSSSE